MDEKSINWYQRYELIVLGLLTTTIISGKLISKFAPKIGTAMALSSYLAAGVVSAGFITIDLINESKRRK